MTKRGIVLWQVVLTLVVATVRSAEGPDWEPWKILYGDDRVGVDVSFRWNKRFTYPRGEHAAYCRLRNRMSGKVSIDADVITISDGKRRTSFIGGTIKPGSILTDGGCYTIASSLEGLIVKTVRVDGTLVFQRGKDGTNIAHRGSSTASKSSTMTYPQCQDLNETRNRLPALYLETIASLGDVARAQREAEATLDDWQMKLAQTDDRSPEQFRALNKWVLETAYRNVKTAIAFARSPADAIGATKLPREVLNEIGQGRSPREAIEKALKNWLMVQYSNASVDLNKTLETILEKATHLDELLAIESQRRELRTSYMFLISKTRANLVLFKQRADRLRASMTQIDAYREAIDRTLRTDCSWAFAK
jgi:hypothetical protein